MSIKKSLSVVLLGVGMICFASVANADQEQAASKAEVDTITRVEQRIANSLRSVREFVDSQAKKFPKDYEELEAMTVKAYDALISFSKRKIQELSAQSKEALDSARKSADQIYLDTASSLRESAEETGIIPRDKQELVASDEIFQEQDSLPIASQTLIDGEVAVNEQIKRKASLAMIDWSSDDLAAVFSVKENRMDLDRESLVAKAGYLRGTDFYKYSSEIKKNFLKRAGRAYQKLPEAQTYAYCGALEWERGNRAEVPISLTLQIDCNWDGKIDREDPAQARLQMPMVLSHPTQKRSFSHGDVLRRLIKGLGISEGKGRVLKGWKAEHRDAIFKLISVADSREAPYVCVQGFERLLQNYQVRDLCADEGSEAWLVFYRWSISVGNSYSNSGTIDPKSSIGKFRRNFKQ